MKRNKSIALALAVVMATMTACGGNEASTSDTSKAQTESKPQVEKEFVSMQMDASTVKTIGRTYFADDTYWLAMSGTGLEFSFTGEKLEVVFVGDSTSKASKKDAQARVAIYVDNVRVADEMINEAEKKVTAIDVTEAKTSTVKIVKLSESANSVCGVKLNAYNTDKLEATPSKGKLIEFVGDSITCGYGVDDENKLHHFSTETEDFTKTYAYKASELLGADYTILAASGYGIISGYSGDGKKVPNQIITKYYDKIGFSYQSFGTGEQPQNLDYDFKAKPDLIVINLGTNDSSYVKGDEVKEKEYIDAYITFLKTVREKNPDADILCALGIMGGELFPAIEEVVETYSAETGDKKVHTLKFDQQIAKDGLAADWHPTERTHVKAADKLVEKIKEIKGW